MKALRLRSFRYETDLDDLYAYMSDPTHQILFSHKFQCNTIQAFEHWFTGMLHTTYHDFYMVETEERKTIGFTFSYEFFPNDRHCKLTLCLYYPYRNRGYGAIAGAQMLDYLFSSYSLQQVFTTVFGYNSDSLSVNQHAGFRKVGELPNYRYLNRSYAPEMIQTDNGSEFNHTSKTDRVHPLDVLCRQLHITHKTIRPKTPWHNGKVERSHRNDQERFYNFLHFYSYEDLLLQMRRYLRRSNRILMSVLGWKSPIQKRRELEATRML